MDPLSGRPSNRGHKLRINHVPHYKGSDSELRTCFITKASCNAHALLSREDNEHFLSLHLSVSVLCPPVEELEDYNISQWPPTCRFSSDKRPLLIR